MREHTVSVRNLCAFTAKRGDLDLRFTPSPTAREGIAGHRAVAARRAGSWQSEVTLAGRFEALHVRGRADAWNPEHRRLEEIKTHRGDAALVPDNHRALHWAQAETYAHLTCMQDGHEAIEAALIYFDLDSATETPIVRHYAAAELRARFDDRCARWLRWSERQAARHVERDRQLQTVPFPHADFRCGQRELAEAVYRSARDGRALLAQAPTGIGKTLATIFAALKAMAAQRIDKVFYLTAKTSGRQLALDGLRTLKTDGSGSALRVIELVARGTLCEHPGQACHGDACPLARGFYDRLDAARDAASAEPLLDQQRIRAVARAHGVCPYYLSQEMVRWSDVVVGDFNHWFDAGALLREMTVEHEWRAAVLVDEAHNLVDRARSMYSAELDRDALRGVLRAAPPVLKPPLSRLDRCWNNLIAGQRDDYVAHASIDDAFTAALTGAIAAIGEHQAERRGAIDPDLLQFFFEATAFAKLQQGFDATHSLFDSRLAPPRRGRRRAASTLGIRNVVPAPHLASSWRAATSTTLFSATLAPFDFYRAMLGAPEATRTLDVASPFDAGQLRVHIARHISTRFADRAASLPAIAQLIADQFDAVPGNYIAFFSSFDYLQQTADELARTRPDISLWRQAPRMAGDAQAAFLANFDATTNGVGFAVLGGRFGEGIDLPGKRLVGAFIATLGLPQVNPANEHMRRVMDARFGAGYEFTYLYPGLRKVVQAAGRVIRSVDDEGVVHLIDDRFAQVRVQALLPGWWHIDTPSRRAPRDTCAFDA